MFRRLALVTVLVSMAVAAVPAPAQAFCSWAPMVTPNKGTDSNFPADIDARSATDAWYVGKYRDSGGSDDHPLSAHFNGTAWKLVKAPDPAAKGWLNAVDVLRDGTAWAVGGTLDASSTDYGTLRMFWNGAKWVVGKAPRGEPEGASLNDVLAISPTDVWVVGYAGTKGLVEHFDGVSWSMVKHPNPGTGSNAFYALGRVPSSKQIWVVGSYAGAPVQEALTLRWSGRKWKQFLVPTPPPQSEFKSVVAFSKTDVWAAGYQTGLPNTWGTFAAHFDGTGWSIVATPHPSTGFPGEFVYDLAGISSTDIYMVGSFESGSVSDPLLVHWDGGSWMTQTVPSDADMFELQAATKVPGSLTPWLLGYEYNSTRYESRVLTYC